MKTTKDCNHDPGDGNGPIVVRSVLTDSTSEMSFLKYIDPADGEEYCPSTLSSVAKGHIYSYQQAGASRFLIKNAIRCFDWETAQLVKSLTSFENGPDAQRLHPSAASNKKLQLATTYSFYLSEEDLSIFQLRVEAMDSGPGVLNNLAVSVPEYLKALRELSVEVLTVHESLVDLRSAQAAVESRESAEAATASLLSFCALRDQLRASQHTVWGMAERLVVKEGSEHERMDAEQLVKDLTVRCTQLLAIQTYREAQVIEAARRKAAGEKEDGLHVGRLRDELLILKKFFPQLKYVNVDVDPEQGEVLKLSIADVVLNFSTSQVWGEGNLNSLGPIFGEGVDLDVADDTDFGYDGVSFADLG